MDYYDLFGVDRPEGDVDAEPAGEGAEAQEVTEPAGETPEEGGNGQEVAEPAGDAPETGDAAPQEAERPQSVDRPQNAEQRREYAARRRRAEQQAAINAAVAAERERADREWEEYLRTAGIRNPYNENKLITTRQELDEYRKNRDDAELERSLKSGKLTRETLEKVVESSPAVAAARQVLSQQQASAAAAAQAARYREVDRQFAALRDFDPTVQSLEQLMTGERADEFRENVAATHDLVKAYKLTYFDTLQSREREVAGRAAASRGAGKEHLRTSQGRSAGAPTLTNARIAEYRAFMPDASLEDIRKFEEKFQKGT